MIQKESFMKKHISDLTEAMVHAVRKAGELLLSQSVVVNSHKTANDLLTENDLQTESFIIKELKKRFPDINIVSEEYNPDARAEGVAVVIDPIDGTCNYAKGLDLFGIQLAAFEGGECVSAVIYFPVSGEMITAEKGSGAYLNGKRLTVDKTQKAADGILLISDYYEGMDIPFDTQFELVKALQKKFLKTRHLGAACVDFSMMAKGHAVAYITYYHKIWDIAPGLLVSVEAGCVFSHLSGREYSYGEPGLVVANNEENLRLILESYNNL